MTPTNATPADVLAGAARWCVVEGDCADVLRSLPDGGVDAVVSDPPSGIAFMGAEWDRNKGGRAQWCAWLAGVLSEARRATRDGGRAIVWSLPRTAHWTGCAVEDAGWSIETKLYHLFGTGWPKGKSQLKPAAEEWLLARNGRSEALNVDACRVAAGGASPSIARREAAARRGAGPASARPCGIVDRSSLETYTAARGVELAGRYPPNLLLSHAEGCACEGTREVEHSIILPIERTTKGNPAANTYGDGCTGSKYGGRVAESVEAWRCVEGCPVAELDRQSGVSSCPSKVTRGAGGQHGAYGAIGAQQDVAGYGDTGTASRYFPQFPADDPDAPWSEALFQYVAKPSRAERNAGVGDPGPRRKHGELPSGDAFGNNLRAGNTHPTVKPVALMRWLIRLVTRPGDVIVDPFGGSGTTGVAALLEGRRVILCEREPEFAAIARARCEAAAQSAPQLALLPVAEAV